MLTTFDQDEYVYEAMTAGASGFLLKDTRRSSSWRRSAWSPRATPCCRRRSRAGVIAEFAAAPVTGVDAGRRASPTSPPGSCEVLQLVAKGLSNGEIAAHLVLSETTVKTHVAHVLAKLHLRDRVQAVVLAYEAGVVQPGDGEA